MSDGFHRLPPSLKMDKLDGDILSEGDMRFLLESLPNYQSGKLAKHLIAVETKYIILLQMIYLEMKRLCDDFPQAMYQ